jgi:hypothetical protein
MLPRIAQLWRQGRILYFVATNLLKDFDQAIIRSQRFDLKIFVAPPSFESKVDRLRKLFGPEVLVNIREKDIEDRLSHVKSAATVDGGAKVLPDEYQLAKFVLLRWDQMDEVAYRLKALAGGRPRVDASDLVKALAEMADKNIGTFQPYLEFFDQRASVGRDFGRVAVWKVETDGDPKAMRRLRQLGKVIDGPGVSSCWLETTWLEKPEKISLLGFRCREPTPGELRVTRKRRRKSRSRPKRK